MNKVAEKCQKETNAKFYYASKRLFAETKVIKLGAYFLSVVPIILSFIPAFGQKKTLVFAATMVSFGLTLFTEFISSFLSGHKENAILLNQMYEVGVTGAAFSKTEYDREMTNKLNEIAIRKGLPYMSRVERYNNVEVPQEVDDRYAYLYMCRLNSGTINYLVSRMHGIYITALIVIIALFTYIAFLKNDMLEFLQLIIQFYPLTIPIIRNVASCSKTMRYCGKISADIDNFFSDGDYSVERLARFLYYVQNIEFEMLMSSPTRYDVFYKVYKNGIATLQTGITMRFIGSVNELKAKALIAKGVTVRNSRNDILTGREIDLKTLEKRKKLMDKRKAEQKIAEKSGAEPEKTTKPQNKDVVPNKTSSGKDTSVKSQNKDVKTTEEKKAKPSTAKTNDDKKQKNRNANARTSKTSKK